MSVEVIYHRGYRIIHSVLEGVVDHDDQMEQVRTIARLVEESDRPVLLLVNAKGFMPTKDYMDFASREADAHKDKVAKSAYYNVDGGNKAMFELFNKFNRSVGNNRKAFRNRNDALQWLTADDHKA
jgi:hypothetical protein